ncbi:hypothetical protein C8Q73DRAFT_669904 [Cubamyces lactineus]|nr:hypothetical protein C8Q73DRAFT_669904 [Cubamyces lactineus]
MYEKRAGSPRRGTPSVGRVGWMKAMVCLSPVPLDSPVVLYDSASRAPAWWWSATTSEHLARPQLNLPNLIPTADLLPSCSFLPVRLLSISHLSSRASPSGAFGTRRSPSYCSLQASPLHHGARALDTRAQRAQSPTQLKSRLATDQTPHSFVSIPTSPLDRHDARAHCAPPFKSSGALYLAYGASEPSFFFHPLIY